MRIRGVLLAVGLLYGGQAFGTNISFVGAFSTDDQLQQFTFTLSSTATVTLRTWSYAGGTNANGAVIPRGGFDPWLSLYSPTGVLMQSVDNFNPPCGPVATDPNTGACFDSFISQALLAGTYTLVLSQSDNQPAGGMLSDGFTNTGNPTFTSSFGCSNGQFCESTTDNRTNQWAVDLDNVTSATGPSGVPEPGTLVLLAGGFTAISVPRRRRVCICARGGGRESTSRTRELYLV